MSNNAQTPYNPLVRKTGTQQGRALDAIAASGFGQQHVGVTTRPLPGGVSIAASKRAEAAATGHPFKCFRRKNDGTADIEQGTINGKFAASYNVAVSDTGTVYVYVSVTPTFTDIEDFITGASFSSFTFGSGSSVPADSATTFYRAIATYVNGVKTGQTVRNSLEVAFCGTVSEPSARWGISG